MHRGVGNTVRNTARVLPKKQKCVGWVEERNPTFGTLCWVSLRSTQPTNILNCGHSVNYLCCNTVGDKTKTVIRMAM
ncbi:hypothetical protein DP116_15770 [Brasilonema bromeliae SPC951]|uniref:Uncharacterized protein n=1 Tax=Brasilonema bromeliae SPC951 TaxID=385972 RepID=A0ABX1PBD7_9CYAN|nr:hypothetical protein [Brasilonema bromeliae SPC951]